MMVLLENRISNINLKTLILGWVQDVPVQIDTLQFLKFKQRYVRLAKMQRLKIAKMELFKSTISIWSLNHKAT